MKIFHSLLAPFVISRNHSASYDLLGSREELRTHELKSKRKVSRKRSGAVMNETEGGRPGCDTKARLPSFVKKGVPRYSCTNSPN